MPPFKPIDSQGNALSVGDKVLFKKAPESLIKDLLPEDQKAIKDQEGKAMDVIGFTPYGHVEMEFTAADGSAHTIWVEPTELFKI